MTFRWRADNGWHGSYVIFQGILTSIAKKPCTFVYLSANTFSKRSFGDTIKVSNGLDPDHSVGPDLDHSQWAVPYFFFFFFFGGEGVVSLHPSQQKWSCRDGRFT